MAILKDLTVIGDSRVTGNEYVTGAVRIGANGSCYPNDPYAINGGQLFNVATGNDGDMGTTISITTSNYFATAVVMTINVGSDTTINGGFTLHTSCDRTPSADAGNTKYQGSNGIVYIKYTGTSSSVTVIPEWTLRNGNRNGDCAAGGTISGGKLTITVGFRCMKNTTPTRWHVKLASNDSPYTITPQWYKGPFAGTHKDTYLSGKMQGITGGKVMLSKWAGEDCSLETDGHSMTSYDDASLYTLGFIKVHGGIFNNLNDLFLFPEHTSKYTVYTSGLTGKPNTSNGWPVNADSGRCTVSKLAPLSTGGSSGDRNYIVEQHADLTFNMIDGGEYVGSDNYMCSFKRCGVVKSADSSTNAGTVTWGYWVKLTSSVIGMFEDTTSAAGTQSSSVVKTIYLPPAEYYSLKGTGIYGQIKYILPPTELLPPIFRLDMTSSAYHSNMLYANDETTLVDSYIGASGTNTPWSRAYATAGGMFIRVDY